MHVHSDSHYKLYSFKGVDAMLGQPIRKNFSDNFSNISFKSQLFTAL